MGGAKDIFRRDAVFLNCLRHIAKRIHGVGVAALVSRAARPDMQFFVPLVLELIEALDDSGQSLVNFQTNEDAAEVVELILDTVRLIEDDRVGDAVLCEHLLV